MEGRTGEQCDDLGNSQPIQIAENEKTRSDVRKACSGERVKGVATAFLVLRRIKPSEYTFTQRVLLPV